MPQALIGRCYIDVIGLICLSWHQLPRTEVVVSKIVEYATVKGIFASPGNEVNRMPAEETNAFSSQVTAAHPKPMPAAILSPSC